MKPSGLSKCGVFFFAVATIAFGVQHLVYGDFVMGRAPAWPSGVPGQLAWASVSGVLLVGLGAAVAIGKNGRAAAIGIAAIVFGWALMRHLLSAHWSWGTEITQTGKALVLFGGALSTAAISSRNRAPLPDLSFWFLHAGRLVLRRS